ncbi:MAG: DUF4194 domain-containing protein [Treponema sp.]|nr:DUF4194 domain-containing protein [Treponema sp.]
MKEDLDALALIRDLNGDDFELFRTAVQILTSKTFIIRGIDKERELYDFAVRNSALFEAWFSCMGASVDRDEGLGVIAFRGLGSTRLFFSKDEICAVLVLRLIYEDVKLKVTLTKFPVVSVKDFQDKYKAQIGEEISKTAFVKVLKKLSSCKLLSIESQDYANPEGLIQLYPSIPFSIGRQALDEAVAMLADAERGDSEEEDE